MVKDDQGGAKVKDKWAHWTMVSHGPPELWGWNVYLEREEVEARQSLYFSYYLIIKKELKIKCC